MTLHDQQAVQKLIRRACEAAEMLDQIRRCRLGLVRVLLRTLRHGYQPPLRYSARISLF
jgi:hypothetical protein